MGGRFHDCVTTDLGDKIPWELLLAEKGRLLEEGKVNYLEPWTPPAFEVEYLSGGDSVRTNWLAWEIKTVGRKEPLSYSYESKTALRVSSTSR